MSVSLPEQASLARYVPRLSTEWDLVSSEPWREIDGTLCYIDISGFTALSERLARRGRIGAEELTEVLNYVFGKMMAVAYDRGGSLLKFGGDALLLLFTGSDHATQAASAAVEMQAVLREARSYETSAGHLALKMSVGLHSGTVHLFRVGGSHKELILTGPAASMTTEMEETAVAGEVLISSTTKAAIPEGGADSGKGDGWLLNWRKARIECCGWVARADLEPDSISQGMPVALREYLQHGAAEPEHHIATVGFIKFHGVDALMEEGGPPAVAEALDELIRNVQDAVDEDGVTFLASDIDQDGGKIIIVAGVPGVQVDDEGRVLRAARRIADNAGTLPLRIGVNQGHVFVGEIGTDIRATYTIMGDTVNLAARLMTAASPGEVYASPAALDRSHTLFATTPLEPFHVKGKEQPVQAYSVGAESGSRRTEKGGALAFTGRVEELKALRTLVDELFSGKGNAVAIKGERGIGKSRLVDEILPDLKRAIHVNIRAESYGVATPYRPLRDSVRFLLGVQRDESSAMAEAFNDAVSHFLPDDVGLAPLLADVVMVDVPSTHEADQIDPKFRQDRTADLLMKLFSVVCRGPVFFEVEDGHYMDEASSHVMRRIAAATVDQPWLVLTTREDVDGGFDPEMVDIALGPLNDDEARKLVIDATTAAPLRPHDVESIITRAGGLPLFLEEVIGAVRSAGDVDSLPDSLDAVVSSQIDALPALSRRLLLFSSVLGQSFRIPVINQMLEADGIRMNASTRRDLAGFLDPDGPERLRFRHAMIRDVAYRGLSFRRRRELHVQAGEIAEAAAGDHAEAVADVLALHFSLGQDLERAWKYSRMAGDRATEAYANVDAASHYQRALDAGRNLESVSPRERADVLVTLGDVQEAAGMFDEALASYRRAGRLLDDDPLLRADIQEKKARALERAGRYVQALREITGGRRLVEATEGNDEAAVLARLAARGATIRVAQQRDRDAIKQALVAVEQALKAGERAALARAYSVLDLSYRWVGEPEKAVYADQALSIFEELNDLAGAAIVTSNLGVAAYFDGQWDQALDYYERGRDAFLRSGNTVQAAYAEANMAEVLVNQGRLDEAEPLLDDAIRVMRASGFGDGENFAAVQLGRVFAVRGDFEASRELLERARQGFIELGESANALDAAVHLAESYLRAGDPLGAVDILDEAERQAGDEAAVHSPSLLRLRADVLTELGKLEEAQAVVDVALDDAESQGLPYEIALLLTAKNTIVDLRGLPADEAEQRRAAGILSGLGVVSQPEAARINS